MIFVAEKKNLLTLCVFSRQGSIIKEKKVIEQLLYGFMFCYDVFNLEHGYNLAGSDVSTTCFAD